MAKNKKLQKEKKINKSEKILISFLLICIIIVNAFIFAILKINKNITDNINDEIIYLSQKGNKIYEVYQNDKLINIFDNYEDALEYAKQYENSSIKKTGEYGWIWDSNPPFEVYQGYNILDKFANYKDALEYAKNYENSYVFYRKNNSFIWYSNTKMENEYFIKGVSLISQYPELERGCEVTSLAMILNYLGINVSKLTLAEEINKESFYFTLNGDFYNGNPNIGFVGDIYSVEKLGYGVYNEPIFNLFQNYVGERALNLTGIEFEDLLYFINKDAPVLAIINTRFKALPESEFEYLKTTRGNVKITYREHCVVITGYDENYIYFNDPMYPENIQKKPRQDFVLAWEQMGRQAISYAF